MGTHSRFQSLSGGIPVPPRRGLTGSLNARRALKGSIKRRVELKGSIKFRR